MNRNGPIALLALGLLLSSGCTADDSSPMPAGTESHATNGQIDSSEQKVRREEATALRGLLNLFGSKDGGSWERYDGMDSITWEDSKPVENPNFTVGDEKFYRGGKLLLDGFHDIDVPDGKVGADAGSRRENEGASGITLNGDLESVHSIALMKFYADNDYRKVLENQLQPTDTLKVVANKCRLSYGTTAKNAEESTFYKLDLSSGETVYIEGSIQGGGQAGPGYTVFAFYKSQPKDRIAAMDCEEP